MSKVAELKEKMELAKLQKGRWPSIPKLNLGLVKTTAGAAHANGNRNWPAVMEAAGTLTEQLHTLGIMGRKEAASYITRQLTIYLLNQQLEPEEVREIAES